MLNGALYRIVDLQATEGNIDVQLSFNPSHAIFGGHFPGQPVVPGVCLMQMVKEVLELAITQQLQLKKADYLKFVMPVVPVEDEVLVLKVKYSTVEDELVKATAVLSKDAVYFKFQGVFIEFKS
ncbi:3-hydroxyacyl-ACP dehydratase [Mucilaginibacter koreensis]